MSFGLRRRSSVSIGREGGRLIRTECMVWRGMASVGARVEELRRLGDVGAPLRPVGVEVLRMIAERWGGHADFDPGWLTP